MFLVISPPSEYVDLPDNLFELVNRNGKQLLVEYLFENVNALLKFTTAVMCDFVVY